MSVCTFGAEELANVAAVIVARSPTLDPENLREETREVCKALALISAANVACFNDRYSHHGANAAPCTAEEIERALARLDVVHGATEPLRRAVATVELLHYNCDDSGGDFTLKVEGAHAALVRILECVMLACAAKAGVR